MGAEVVEFNGGCGTAITDGTRNDRPLEWYKVVGIELVLFVGTLVPLVYGALLAR